MGEGICQACHLSVNDGRGPGYVHRHNQTEAHVEAIKRNQAKAKELLEKRDAKGYVPWEAVDVDAVEYREEEEIKELRRALELLQQEEVE